MKKIRIGKDINIKCHILTNNKEVSLIGRCLTVYLISSYGRKYEMKYIVEDTSILFTFLGIEQKDEGNYTLTIYENQYKEKQSIVDICDCFKLVKCTCLEEDDTVDNNIEIETVDLSANIEFVGATGASDVTKEYVDSQLLLKLDKSVYDEDKQTFATKDEIPSIDNFATKEELNAKANTSDIPTNISELTNDSGYITSIPSEYITESELASKGYVTTTELGTKLDISVYNSEKVSFATTTQLSDYITTSTANSTFATKEELGQMNNILDNINGEII